ncbi:MAG: hypothetical protein ABR591_10410 [Candidatus Velthaea sp.]
MRRFLSIALAFAASLALAGAATASMTPTQFKLSAQNGSGESGTATLLQETDGDLLVNVRTSNGGDEAQPIHIHKGTCEKLDPKPAYPLTTVQNGKSETKLKGVKLADLEKGDYAINIHKSTKEVSTYVTCGNLKVAAAPAASAAPAK